MKNCSTKEFCEKYNICSSGVEFAKDYPDMHSCYQALLDGKAGENSYGWAQWVFFRAADKKTRILYIVWCARRVEHLTTDERSKNALNVAERYANGLATEAELKEAVEAAETAAYAAYCSADATYRAAYRAVYRAAHAADYAAYAAYWAAHAANGSDYAAERQAQLERLREIGNVFEVEA